jgi:nitrogen fixation protein FixH
MRFYKSPMIMSMLGLFLALVLATFYRIVTAIDSNPGLVVEDAYKSGGRYDETLANKKFIKQQGYELEVFLPKKILFGRNQSYEVELKQNGVSLDDNQVTLFFYRPLNHKDDFSSSMTYSDGKFTSDINLPLKGRWDLVVESDTKDGKIRKAQSLFAE